MVAVEISAAALVGAFAGLILVAILDPAGQMDVDSISLIVGALVGVGIQRALRG
jgi:hypothetical protein